MNVIKIDKNNLVNGPGARVVLWLAGCCHNCPECHNPETQDSELGHAFSEADREILYKQLKSKNIDGITITGGDPLMLYNYPDLLALLKDIRIKFPNKTIWMWTGYRFEHVLDNDLLKYIDVLVDGRFIKELKPKRKALRYRGSLNQRVIDIQKTLESGDITYWEDFDGWKSSKDKVKSLEETFKQYKIEAQAL